MLRLPSKQESGSQSARKQPSSQISKYFLSNKSLFTKTQQVSQIEQSRPPSRGNLAFDYAKGFNSTLKNAADSDNKSLEKLMFSVDKLKATKISTIGSTKKLSFHSSVKKST